MSFHRRITWAEMAYTRNPNPARGPEVYSLDELRHYCRLFWRNRMYGVCHVSGGQKAFSKACGLDKRSFIGIFIDEPPKQQYLRADTQRRVSKAVRNVLTGKIHYETDPQNVRGAIGKFDFEGKPPAGVKEFPRTAEFRLQYSRFGPRLHRLA